MHNHHGMQEEPPGPAATVHSWASIVAPAASPWGLTAKNLSNRNKRPQRALERLTH